MLFAMALLSPGIAACGQAVNRAGSTFFAASSSPSHAKSPSALVSMYRARASGQALPEPARDQPRLANDGDSEQPGDEDQDNNHDSDNDKFADYQPIPDNSVYHDADDRVALEFGQAASARDTQAVATLVRSYYAMAVARDGAGACSMIEPNLARAVSLDYGKFGPVYLRRGKTCATVLTLLFSHEHRRLPSAIQVTGVRVDIEGGLAFFGSKTIPASDIKVRREGSSWKVAELLGVPLT